MSDPEIDKALQKYLERLKKNFPDFVRFGKGDEALEVNERTYKLELVELFKQNIESSLRALPTDETSQTQVGDELVRLFTRKLSTGVPQNLVGWRYWGPLTKLTASGKAAFAQLTTELLYGEGDYSNRIDQFVPSLKDLLADSLGGTGWAAMSRSLTSFLLMLSDPSTRVIIKTQEFKRALKTFTGGNLPNRPLTGEDYRDVQAFLGQLREAMQRKGLAPRDMIDVQTLIWVG